MPASARHSRPNNDQTEELPRPKIDRSQPCDDLRSTYIGALGRYLTTWRDEPVEGRTDDELRAMVNWFHAGDDWERCLQEQRPDRKRARMLAALFAKRDELTRRLNDGESKINAATAAGEHTESWDDFWIGLLRDYESVEQQITEATRVDVVPRDTVETEDEGVDDRADDVSME